uniref:28S ribosomal protein S27, mitochondrial-like n=1 Tax=Dermatophagoides pteronyssinus TaxID=6956 RepID=A0A6P6XR46_DERPT|nr:28S ribosomal protein S27, mitochondrial-like [Dermatophagoides pteronyssinus]
MMMMMIRYNNRLKLYFLNTFQQFRTLLSSSYSCDNEWSKRFEQDETLKHISTERYFFELNQKYQQKKPVTAIDVDIFINSLHRPESQMELEHILRRFRQTPKTVDTLESTHHATCRFYLAQQKRSELMHILNNRIEYGIFPDHFINNIFLDQSIRAEEWFEAFDVIKLMMLQEDSGNDITKTLSLFVLNRLLIDNQYGSLVPIDQEDSSTDKKDDDDDDEIEYIRVPFLTNPYFDDHFDLTNRNHIFGKCLYFFGRELEKSLSTESNEELKLAHTSMVIGLIYYQKWERLLRLFDRIGKSLTITAEPIKVIDKHLELFKVTELETIKSRLNELTKIDQTSSITMSTLIDKRIEDLPKLESSDIANQQELFDQFQTNRRKVLDEQMERLLRERRRQEIEQKQQEFEEKKRLYYFFENFPKHEIDFTEAEKRIAEIRSKTVVEEDYVPPERY